MIEESLVVVYEPLGELMKNKNKNEEKYRK